MEQEQISETVNATIAFTVSDIWPVALVLGLVAIGGAFGGQLRYISSQINNGNLGAADQNKTKEASFHKWIGIGGAVAAYLALSWAGKFPLPLTPSNVVFILFLSVIAGFVGRTVLNSVSSKLEKQLAGVEKTTNEAKETSLKAKEEAERSLLEVKDAISKAEVATMCVILSSTLDGKIGVSNIELKETADQGVKCIKKNGNSRFLTLLTGRVYRRVADDYIQKQEHEDALKMLKKAISVLSGYLETHKNNKDRDYADILYNRACYKAVMAPLLHADRIEEFEASASQDLKESIEIEPLNEEYAKEDPDLQGLVNKS